MKKFTQAVLAGTLLTISTFAMSQEFFHASEADGMWFMPDNPGHGLVVNYNYSNDVAAVTWFLHRPDRSSAFLSGLQLCQFFPCVLELVETSASLLGGAPPGVGTFFELGETVGEVELTLLNNNEMRVKYNFIPWLSGNTPKYCSNISAMGYLWRGCAGTLNMVRLTRSTLPTE